MPSKQLAATNVREGPFPPTNAATRPQTATHRPAVPKASPTFQKSGVYLNFDQ
jgi:hypothetical protein